MKPSRTRKTTLPPLHNGDRLSQVEFHRRYEAYPEDVKFELIGGVVYMASPLKRPHGTSDFKLGGPFILYEAATPGVEGAHNMTAILGEKSEPQPDLMLRLIEECGGQSRYNDEDYLVGAPELIAEVAHSSKAIDMNRKRQDYLAAGVQEYVVFCVEEQELHWFHFPSKRKLKPDRNGVWKSQIFPGLWINGPALIAGDLASLIATAQQGLTTAEHAEFVRRLDERRQRLTAT
jgi:hypothetical protein